MQKTKNNAKKRKIQARKEHKWSEYQKNIFTYTRSGKGHSIILACPGSGKSATIIESLYHIPKNESKIALAFNTAIVEHLLVHVPLGAAAKTFHGLGLEAVKNNWSKTYSFGRKFVDVNNEAAFALATSKVGSSDDFIRLRLNLVHAMKMAKTMLAESVEEIDNITCKFGISTCGIDSKDFAFHVKSMMEETKDKPLQFNGKNVISFEDMLWLPYVHGWMPKQYNHVFVDEAQDLSRARVSLALKALKNDGRLFAYGDRHQTIFRWAGAGTEIIDYMTEHLKARKLPLSVSYRCPKKVVALAQEINSNLEAAPDADDGNIESISSDNLVKHIKNNNSIILSRTNFPLITTAFSLIKNGIKANIIGKDIGNRFIWRINCWNPSSVEELQTMIISWKYEICAVLENKKMDSTRIEDEADSILLFTKDANNLNDVIYRIRSFFSDDLDDGHIKLSTVHKAKGLEWDNVYLLEYTFKHGKNDEEDCIYYVAITRAKKNLIFVRNY